MLSADEFETIDRLIARFNERNYSASVGIAFLAITLPVKSKLKHRPDLYARIEKYIIDETDEDPNQVLAGLQ
jgi:hypothetical protein